MSKGKEAPLNRKPRMRHGLWVQSRTALDRRECATRSLIMRARKLMHWITDADMPALRSWAELEIVASQLWINLQDEGPFLPNREPRRVLTEYRQMKLCQLAF